MQTLLIIKTTIYATVALSNPVNMDSSMQLLPVNQTACLQIISEHKKAVGKDTGNQVTEYDCIQLPPVNEYGRVK